ncbi:MAG: tRNA (cytidine(56)-2'-O)-methyltransferase [Thermoplasmata archaeon]|nr:tRNA (cytidine(56)-2'-O)-methyltransferase [Thermoplasmata archaeon]
MPRPRRSAGPRVSVLRIGHRAGRDPRLTTHVALTARAFGAERLYLHPGDAALAERIARVAATWGGSFAVEAVRDWKRLIREFDGVVVHLTMYGEPVARVAPKLRRATSVLLVVGGAKVPPDLYRLAAHNVAVGHQPHSEVAALAVILAKIRGIPGPGVWPGARAVLVPQAHGKKVVAIAEGAG